MSSKKSVDKLMVVAHPDDESIFGGGALMYESGWKVICLTNGSNEIRSREFQQAMNFAGASFEIWDYPDIYDGAFDEEQVKDALEEVLNDGYYRQVVTHNLDGEYGHSQHRALSRIFHRMNLDNLYVFETADEPLPFHILQKKLKLLEHYISQRAIIEQLIPFIENEQVVRFDQWKSYNSLHD